MKLLRVNFEFFLGLTHVSYIIVYLAYKLNLNPDRVFHISQTIFISSMPFD